MVKKSIPFSKIYFIVPISGPINGAKMISRYILNAFEDYNTQLIDTAQAINHLDHGSINFDKIVGMIKILYRVVIIKNNSIVYLNYTPQGFANFRDTIILVLLRLKRCQITIHLHTNFIVEKSRLFLKIFINDTKCITINNYQTEYLKNIVKVVQINNSLPSIDLTLNPKKKFDTQTLLFFSNICIEKGALRLLHLFNHLVKRKKRYKFKIVGGFLDKNIEDIFNDYAAQYNNFELIGYVSDPVLKSELFNNSSIFLFLSDPFYEASPLVLIESLNFGLPIISTKQYVLDDINIALNGFIYQDDVINYTIDFIINLLDDYKLYQKVSYSCYLTYCNNYNFDGYISDIKKAIING